MAEKTPNIARVDLDGQHDTKLYQGKFASEYRVSPDGNYLAFAERFKVFVTPLVERGDVIDIGPKAKNLPVEQLSVRAGEGVNWNGKSNKLYWSLGADLYQASVEGLFDITAKSSDKNTDDKVEKSVTKASVAKPTVTNLSYKEKVDIPSGHVAFVGGNVITMEGEQVIENGVVLVAGNKIKALGTKAQVKIPSDATIIDISGKNAYARVN